MLNTGPAVPPTQPIAIAIPPHWSRRKMVVAASGIIGTESAAVLARLDTDGTLDTGFGSGGYVTFSNRRRPRRVAHRRTRCNARAYRNGGLVSLPPHILRLLVLPQP